MHSKFAKRSDAILPNNANLSLYLKKGIDKIHKRLTMIYIWHKTKTIVGIDLGLPQFYDIEMLQ